MSSKVLVGSLFVALVALAASACSSTKTATGPEGAPVTGALDAHCGGKSQAVDPATCHAAPVDAGPPAADAGPPEDEYGPTMYNAEADDDQCKYHLKWSVSGARTSGDATFTVTVTSKSDGKPLVGANPRVELFLDETHPAPNTNQKPTETAPGVYTIGPLKFDVAGKWTARFHFFEDCNDGDESPHGHAAFFVSVP
jgi:hypothetical protein